MSEIAEKLGRLAKDALVFEARLTPKPGLVDAENNGSHADMDLGLLLTSADVLEPFFMRFAETGEQEVSLEPDGRIKAIRPDGVAAVSVSTPVAAYSSWPRLCEWLGRTRCGR